VTCRLSGRTRGSRIGTPALNSGSRRLPALLPPGAGDCEVYDDVHELQARLEAEPWAIIVYNQHADAIALVDRPEV